MDLKGLLIDLNETNRKIEMLQSDTPESRAYIEAKSREVFGDKAANDEDKIKSLLDDLKIELQEAY